MHLAVHTPPPPGYEDGLCCGCGCGRFEVCETSLVSLIFSLADFLPVACVLVLCKFSAGFLLALLSRSLLQVRCWCSALCLLCDASDETENLMQEMVQGVIENHSR